MKGLYKYILVFTLLFSNVAVEAQSQFVNFNGWGTGNLTGTKRSDGLQTAITYTGCLTATINISNSENSWFSTPRPDGGGESMCMRLYPNWTVTTSVVTMTVDIGKQTDGSLVDLPTKFRIRDINAATCSETNTAVAFIDRVSVVGYKKNTGSNTVNTTTTLTPNSMTNDHATNTISSNTITGGGANTANNISSTVTFTNPVCRIVIRYFSGNGAPPNCTLPAGSAWPLTINPGAQHINISPIEYTVASCPDLLVLPVELTSFDLKTESNKTVKVFWQTATELNNEKFIVERSENGTDFYSIGEVKGHGTTQEKQDYEFVDAKPKPGILYYRLRQVDYDGKNEVHQTISAEISLDDFIVFPNPAKEYISLSFKNKDALPDKIELMNYTGELIQSDVVKENDIYNFDVKHLAKGIYFIKVFYNQTIQVKNFVIEN